MELEAAASTGVQWRPGFHDPDALGWVAVIGYFVAAWLCFRAASWPSRPFRLSGDGRLRAFWGVLTGLLVLLGINKQLDLQTLMTEVGREIAKAEGWYGARRTVQAVFVAGLCILSVLALVIAGVLTLRCLLNIWLALAGLVVLVCFVLIRAASFHHVDQMLGMNLAGMKLHWLIEMAGMALIAVSAALAPRRSNEAGKREVSSTM